MEATPLTSLFTFVAKRKRSLIGWQRHPTYLLINIVDTGTFMAAIILRG